MKKHLFCILLLSLCILNGYSGRVFYVSSSYTGAVSNGSLSTPWKSIASVQAAMSTFVAGDSILFKRGDKFGGTLVISKSGTVNNRIVFGAYGTGANPLFWGTGSTIANLFNLGNQDYIEFNSLKISDTTISATDRNIVAKIQTAFGFDVGSSYNVIKKCTLDRVGVGAFFPVTSTYNTIDSCDIGNMRMVVNDNTKSYNDYGANPTVISGSNNTITHNFFHDCWANSYDFGYDGGAVEFYGNGANNNFIAYNTFYDCNNVVEHGSGNGGTISNNTFAYNKFINNGGVFYINNSGLYAVNVSNLAFYNNVIIETAPSRVGTSNLGAMSASSSNQSIAIFKNNIFYVTTGIGLMRYGQWTAGQLVHQNNIFKLSNGSTTNFTLSSNEISTTANLWANTTNSNPLYWDYTPYDNSSVIDFGQSLGYTRDFAGNTLTGIPDAGILEKRVVVTTPLAITVTPGTILCNGSTTSVAVAASGGVSPYTGTGNFSASAGTYTYTVTDATGATKSSTITIAQPAALSITLTAGTIASYGGTTTINVAVTGGSGSGYTYKLNNGSYQTAAQFTRVPAGTHKVTVKDSRGCTNFKTLTITQPSNRSSTGKYSAENGIKNSESALTNKTNTSKNLTDIASSVATENLIIGLYPNPSLDNFYLNVQNLNTTIPLTVIVLNNKGQKLLEQTTFNGIVKIGESLQSGLYIVSVSQNGRIIKTLKAVKI